jgi:hypothetical protein
LIQLNGPKLIEDAKKVDGKITAQGKTRYGIALESFDIRNEKNQPENDHDR